MLKRFPLAAAALLAATLPAFAHLDPVEHGSFAAGFTHPLSGLDHILVMVSVGLWAALIGGRAVWIVPTAFVAAMTIGFSAALAALPLPLVEPVIAASVVALGLLVATAVRLPVPLSAGIVAAFAVFHGFAHGGEMGAAGAGAYGAGFALATALLHASGIALAAALIASSSLAGRSGRMLARLAGGGAALAGMALIVG